MSGNIEVPITPVEPNFSNISRNDFPPDFLFGTSTAAYQVEGGASEGGRGPSMWDVFALGSPAKILDGTNGNVSVDMYHRYEEDFRTMKAMGLDAYRFSISWSRVLPQGRISLGVNQEGVDYYNRVIDSLIEKGITPNVTLFHWDLPQFLQQEYGGFLSEEFVKDYADYVEFCFWRFGDRVKMWATFNEPYIFSTMGYVSGSYAPSRPQPIFPYDTEEDILSHSNYKQEVYTVGRNLLLGHAKAVEIYRTKFQEFQKGQIGIVLSSNWNEAYSDKPEDVAANQRATDFQIGWFLEPVLGGQYPASMLELVSPENLKPFTEEESKMLKGSIDFLGLNYYTSYYVADNPHPVNTTPFDFDQKIATLTQRDGWKPIGPLAPGSVWLYIVPWGIRSLLKYMKTKYENDTYNLPVIYITENGVTQANDFKLTAEEACKDPWRVNYYRDHIGNVLLALREDKVNVKGYFVWSYCDNYEWSSGYTIRMGMIYVDYMNNLNRHP
ncbi:raucaffricine-O-beta-D-glucosidase-like isoform X2 [Andrographis paniculata]|nr:raucaffricine-O-beta-D-glucosidase-like isoform X2 [Andrographis paniculata]